MPYTPTPSPSSIVHVPRRYVAAEWGGTETVVQEISRQQQQQGWQPVVVTSMALASEAHERLAGIPVVRHRYCYPFFGLSRDQRAALDKKGGNLLSLPLAADLLARTNVRLYHAHALNRLGGTVRAAARLRRKPFVVSLHGGVFDVPEAEQVDLQQPVRGHVEWGRFWGALVGARQVLHDADHVICVGQSETDKARAALAHDRVSHLPNGVNCARFACGDGARFRRDHGIAHDAFLVLNISRIDAQKDQLTLVRAFAKLRDQKANAHLLLIGPETQPDYARRLRKCIATLGIASQVTLLPGIPNAEPALVDALHACDLFVLPSRHEPFGIVALEAWSARRPVIASKVGGLVSLIRHEDTGWHFETGSVESLLQVMQHAASHPGQRQQIAEAGQREARTHYDWSCIAAQLESIYQQAETHHRSR